MIELEHIVVRFGDFEALHDINIEVKEGEFFTFLGPSGCGKTTTLRTITGFISPDEGRVKVKGKDITNVPIEKRNIGKGSRLQKVLRSDDRERKAYHYQRHDYNGLLI